MHRYRLAPAHNVALLSFAGAVDGEDFITAIRTAHQDPAWVHGMDVIWDCLGVTSLDVLPQQMAEVLKLRTEESEGRDASVVDRIVDEGIAHLYSMIAERRGRAATVCHSFEEAFDALGLSEAAAEALNIKSFGASSSPSGETS